MRGRGSLLLILLLLIPMALPPPVGSFPEAGDNVPVVVGPETALSPSLAVDHSGNLHLVWSDDRSGERGIHYARATDGPAGPPAVRLDTPGADSYLPRIAVDGGPGPYQGRLYVAFERRVLSEWSAWLGWSPRRASWP